MLEDEGNFNTSGSPWLRSANINELDQFTPHHRLNEHIGKVVVAGEDGIAGPGCPIEQPFGRKLVGREAGLQEVPEQ